MNDLHLLSTRVDKHRGLLYLGAILVAFVAWAAWFIIRSSSFIGGERFFSLFDDAMISMCYARNLVEGYGLNWARQGQPVEGYTCPLWTFLMVPINALGLPLRLRPLGVQILGMACLVANILVVRQLVVDFFRESNRGTWIPATLLTACYYPLNFWSLRGMETGLQALLFTAVTYLCLRVVHTKSDRYWALAVCLSLCILLRPDMVLAVAACLFYVRRVVFGENRALWIWPLGLIVATTAGYELFRLAYFGDWLPNTYYLKLTGTSLPVRILRGILVTERFFAPLWIPLTVLAVWLIPTVKREHKVRLPVAIVLLYFAYNIYIGGDAWENGVAANRFIAPVMPLVFVLLNYLFNKAVACWQENRSEKIDDRTVFYAHAGFTVIVLYFFLGFWGNDESEKIWRKLVIADRPFCVGADNRIVAGAKSLTRYVKPGSVIAVQWAGTTGFFTDYKLVDVLGYSEKRIARKIGQPFALDDAIHFRPGHTKFDPVYVMRNYKPDAIFRADKMYGVAKKAGYRQVTQHIWVNPAALRKQKPKPSGFRQN